MNKRGLIGALVLLVISIAVFTFLISGGIEFSKTAFTGKVIATNVSNEIIEPSASEQESIVHSMKCNSTENLSETQEQCINQSNNQSQE